MATYVVTTRDDVVDAGDGALSLREALAQTATHAGADTITFDAGVFTPGNATILLTQGKLEITQAGGPVTIQGDLNGDHTADVTIDAGGQSRVLEISGTSASEQAQVTLVGVTLTGGDAQIHDSGNGGAIDASQAILQIADCAITGNTGGDGGGIAAENCTLTLTGCAVNGNSAYVRGPQEGFGGGIFAHGSDVTVVDSTVSRNHAAGYRTAASKGGGIEILSGALTLTGSEVSYNSADVLGGGILVSGSCMVTNSTITHNSLGGFDYSYAVGAGISAWGVTVIESSTISDNHARGAYRSWGGGLALGGEASVLDTTISGNTAVYEGGAIYVRDGASVEIVNSTIVENAAVGWHSRLTVSGLGGGIAGDIARLDNTIVAGNTADADADIFGAIVSNGRNLFSQSGIAGAADGDIVVAADDVIGTVLARAADNGGPTRTYMPFPGSPVIDAGDSADAVDANGEPLATDQRGEPRLVGSAVDIGAVEFGASLLVGTARGDVLLGSPGADQIEAWSGDDTAVGLAGADTIEAGAGDDSVQAGNGADYVFGGSGDDVVFLGAGDDILRDPSGADRLHGDTGDDTIIAGTGDDLLFGGDGADSLVAAAGADTVAGDAGDDRIDAGGGNDLVFGGDGDDVIVGSYGADTIYGGAGADHVDGGAGGDRIWLGSGGNYATAGDDDTIYGGSDGDHVELGDAENVRLFAGAGDDSVDGGGADCVVRLGGGDDHVDDGGGSIWGAAGEDVIWLGQAARLVDCGDGDDRVFAASGGRSASGVTVIGGDGNDYLSTGSGFNVVHGEEGNDYLWGSGSLYGGEGDDWITLVWGGLAVGGSGDDWIEAGSVPIGQTMRGGAGDDTLRGAGYAGRMTGGEGADLFFFRFGGAPSGNRNSITDFTPGEDHIDLRMFTRSGELEDYAELQTLFEDRGANTVVHLSDLSETRYVGDVLLLGVSLAELDRPENFLL